MSDIISGIEQKKKYAWKQLSLLCGSTLSWTLREQNRYAAHNYPIALAHPGTVSGQHPLPTYSPDGTAVFR